MNRAAVIRAILAHRAAANALERVLEEDARAEVEEQGTAPRWQVPGALAVTHMTRPSMEIVDKNALLDYLEERFPSEVAHVREVRNAQWLKNLRAALLATGGCDDKGTVVPGLERTEGGEFKHVAITADGALKRDLEATALASARAGDLTLSGLQMLIEAYRADPA